MAWGSVKKTAQGQLFTFAFTTFPVGSSIFEEIDIFDSELYA
jgi:hypothetical protein